MPQTHIESQPTMPKSTSKSLKVPTFIQSIRSTFSLRRRLGCSSASSASTAIRMSADWRPRTQPNTTNNNKNKNSKKNGNFMVSKQRKVVVVAARSNRRHHRQQQQFVDLDSPPTTPNSASDRNKSITDKGQLVAKDTLSTDAEAQARNNRATSPFVTNVALEFDPVFRIPCLETNVIRTSHTRRAPHPSPDEFAEIMMHQTNRLMGRSDFHDQFRDWRLDTEDMTYEQLLALGDKIGYVSTGIKESEIPCYIKKIKMFGKTLLQKAEETEPNCSICQEEYEAMDKLGLLKCAHSYHHDCIKQWLRQKKMCPVCKTEVEAWR